MLKNKKGIIETAIQNSSLGEQATFEQLVAELNNAGNNEERLGTVFKLYGFLSSEKKRLVNRIHPSSIRKECVRKVYYDLTGAESNSTSGHSAGLQRIFDVGTFWHIYVQHKLHQSEIPFKSEVPVINEDLFINGSTDGVLSLEEDYLLEIKSMMSFQFSKLTTPVEDHVFQASLYATVLGIKNIVFLYINKDSGEFKEYIVKTSKPLVREAVQIISDVKKAVEEKTAPNRVCLNEYTNVALACPYRDTCFGLK